MKNKVLFIAGRALSLVLAVACAISLFGCETGRGETSSAADSGENVTSAQSDYVTTASDGGESSTAAPVPSVPFLGGEPLSSWSITYDGDSPCSAGAAHIIADALLKYCGVPLRLIPDPAFTVRNEISARAKDSAGLYPDGKGYGVSTEGGRMTVTGATPLILEYAASRLAEKIKDAGSEFAALSAGFSLSGTVSGEDMLSDSPQSRIGRTSGSDIRIMSFNILHESYNDRLPLTERARKVASVISAYCPDAVGLEEVSAAWHESLESLFGGTYAFIPDDIPGAGPSYSTVFYNTSKAELLEYGTTVFAAATNSQLRNLTWARLRRISDGQEYVVTSTHWDISTHPDERVLQAKENGVLTSGLISKYGLPIFACGDYNRNETTSEFTGFIAATGMKDSKLTALASGLAERGGKSTHTVGQPVSGSSDGSVCIDHIVCTPDVEIKYYTTVIDDEAIDSSDHCPIFVDAYIGKTKTSADKAIPAPESTYVSKDVTTAEKAGYVYSVPFRGSGTAKDPYLIENAACLRYLRDEVNYVRTFGGKRLEQTADIDISGAGWKPIGRGGYPFSGIYDGKGHTVSGLSIDGQYDLNGLFGWVTTLPGVSCSVKNLTVKGEINLSWTTSAARVGGLAGNLGSAVAAVGKTLVESVICDVKISVSTLEASDSSEPRVGGIAGFVANATFRGCENRGDVTLSTVGASRCGGIGGQLSATELARCVNSGSVTGISNGTTYVGGIAGIAAYSEIAQSSFRLCENRGTVKSESKTSAAYSGGIIGVGYSSGDTINISVSECLNSGCVEARVSTGSKLAYGGGIVGYCSKKNFTVDGCVNTYRRIVGSAPSGSRAGGIFGVFNLSSDENAIICKNCVTVGALYGYNKNALADNVQNATEAAASEAAERLRAKIAG